MIRTARSIYFRYLESCQVAPDPVGVVMVGESGLGRVVFDLPVLLIDEHFLPIDLLRNRTTSRSRNSRPQPPRTQSGRSSSAPVPPSTSIPASPQDPVVDVGGRAS